MNQSVVEELLRDFAAKIVKAQKAEMMRVIAGESEDAPKRKGRPPKAKAAAEPAAPAKRRGRPPKAQAEAAASEPKRRGRPPKAARKPRTKLEDLSVDTDDLPEEEDLD